MLPAFLGTKEIKHSRVRCLMLMIPNRVKSHLFPLLLMIFLIAQTIMFYLMMMLA